MAIRQLPLVGAPILFLLTLPCQAGPCSKDIERVQAKINARLNTLAAAGPSAGQSIGAQLHRQPTPNSLANAERKLGELPASTIEKVNNAMTRAHDADSAGDKSGCDSALAEVERQIGQ